MAFNLQKVKDKLANNEPVLGSVVSFTDYGVSEIIGLMGFDFIWLDAEHFPLDGYDVRMHAIAANSGGTSIFVRVRNNDANLVKPLIDAGVDGVIFPQIRTVEDARLAIASCVYPPDGIRGYGPTRCTGFGREDADSYVKNASDRVFKILQVEHYECVENLEEIAQLPGLDALMIGPNDLSSSIGLLGQVEHPEMQKLIARTAEIARKYGITLAASTGYDPDKLEMWLGHGVQMMCIGGDVWYMMDAAKKSLHSVQEFAANYGKRK